MTARVPAGPQGAVCPVCGRTVPARVDGTPAVHHDPNDRPCPTNRTKVTA